MAFSTNAIFETTLHGTWNDQVEMRNVFQLKTSISPATITEEGLIDDMLVWADFIADLLAIAQTALLVWKSFSTRTLDGAFTSGTLPLTSDVPGVRSGDPLAPICAGLITFPTFVPRVVGKKFIGGLPESANTTVGTIGATILADLVTIGTGLCTPVDVGSYSMDYGTRSPKDNLWHPFEVFEVSAIMSPMARRKQGRGI